MAIPQVSVLPELNQNEFPAFPEVPEGKTLIACSTKWQNAEKEFAAGCIVNVCLQAKKWQPIPGEKVVDFLKSHPMVAPFMAQEVATALWTLVDEGSIKVVNFMSKNHFIPTPQLAKVFLADARNLRVV